MANMISKGQMTQQNHAIAYARELYKAGKSADEALQTAYSCYGLGRCKKDARLTLESFERLAFPECDYGCP